MVFPSPVVLLSILAVALAAVAFVATRGGTPDEREVATTVRETTSPSAAASPDATASEPAPTKTPKPKPAIDRGATEVDVFNNTSITGLAGSAATQVTDAGWVLGGTDNWYGTIPTTTVYFPDGMKRAGKQLALDLGVDRAQPAVGAMSDQRLTLILTGAL